MKKMLVVAGATGTGKSRVLLKKMSEMKVKDGVLFVDAEGIEINSSTASMIKNEVYQVKNKKALIKFLEEKKEEIEKGEISLVIDNLKLATNKMGEDLIKSLLKMNFKEKVYSVQTTRNQKEVESSKFNESIIKSLSTNFGIKDESIEIEKSEFPKKYPF